VGMLKNLTGEQDQPPFQGSLAGHGLNNRFGPACIESFAPELPEQSRIIVTM